MSLTASPRPAASGALFLAAALSLASTSAFARSAATVLTTANNPFLFSPGATLLTADPNVVQTGYQNATYDGTRGVGIPVRAGTGTIGVGSFIPEIFTGPGDIRLLAMTVRDANGAALVDHMRHDKKAEGTTLPFLLLRALGEAYVARDVDLTDIAAFLDGELAA